MGRRVCALRVLNVFTKLLPKGWDLRNGIWVCLFYGVLVSYHYGQMGVHNGIVVDGSMR